MVQRIFGLGLAVGNSNVRDFTHVYRDKEKEIIVEPREKNIRVRVYYKTGKTEKEIYRIPYCEFEGV